MPRLWEAYAAPDGRRGYAGRVDDHHEPAPVYGTALAARWGRRPGGLRGSVDGAGGGAARHPRFFPPIVGFLAARVLAGRPEAGVRCRGVPPVRPFKFPILRRDGEALPADWTEAAQVRENDEVLEHLDKNGRAELAAVEAALARIERGEFGRCGRCGAVIPEARVAAMPTASECMECCSE